MTDAPELLSPADVAAILKVHVKTVHVWLREGRLNGTKISYRTWRISRASLEEFLKGRSLPIPPAEDKTSKKSENTPPKAEPAAPGTPHSPLPSESLPPGEMKQYLKGIMREEPASPAIK